MTDTTLIEVVGQQASRLVQILNDSLRIANESKRLSTRVSRLALARSTFTELQSMRLQHPFISFTNLDGVLKSIDDVSADIERAKSEADATPRRPRKPRPPPASELTGTNPLAALPLRDVPFCIVDLETTGLSPKSGARIIEISVIRVEPSGEARVVLDTLVNPQGPVYCTEIHGISDDDVVGAPVFSDIAGDTVAVFEGALVGAFNASFDMGFLAAEFALAQRARGLRAPPPHVCLMWLRPLLGMGSRCSLDAACRELGIEPGGHRAAADAMVCAKMWPRYVEFAEKRGIRTLGDLAQAGSHKYLASLRYPFYGSADVEDAGGRGLSVRLKPRLAPAKQDTAGVRRYWNALVGALFDGVLDQNEIGSLRTMQAEFALSQDQIRAAHARLFADRLREAAEDDALTDREIAGLALFREQLTQIGWAP